MTEGENPIFYHENCLLSYGYYNYCSSQDLSQTVSMDYLQLQSENYLYTTVEFSSGGIVPGIHSKHFGWHSFVGFRSGLVHVSVINSTNNLLLKPCNSMPLLNS